MCNVEVFSLESLILVHLIWTINVGFSSTALSFFYFIWPIWDLFCIFRHFRASLEAGDRFKHFFDRQTIRPTDHPTDR